MFDSDKALALTKWINEWQNTYGEIPSIEECITWIEWKFEEGRITEKEKIKIEKFLNFNRDQF
tara:strand:- start:474 stop:662 length:189 start_codon:yes stop_codon:yes gene_type:complete